MKRVLIFFFFVGILFSGYDTRIEKYVFTVKNIREPAGIQMNYQVGKPDTLGLQFEHYPDGPDDGMVYTWLPYDSIVYEIDLPNQIQYWDSDTAKYTFESTLEPGFYQCRIKAVAYTGYWESDESNYSQPLFIEVIPSLIPGKPYRIIWIFN